MLYTCTHGHQLPPEFNDLPRNSQRSLIEESITNPNIDTTFCSDRYRKRGDKIPPDRFSGVRLEREGSRDEY